MSILLLLCTGVLLVIYTLRAFAASTTITAVVPAAPLSDPAIITSPADSAQLTTQALTVQGTCPDSSYVQLLDNSILAGAVTCSSKTFSISLDLTPGSNVLQAQDYNITNQAGPTSAPTTVTYTPPTPPATAPQTTVVTPIQLSVTEVDEGIPFAPSAPTPVVSTSPRIAGVAPPYSYVTVVIHSNSYTCSATADSQGYWFCLMPVKLEPAIHTVDVTATTPSGQKLTFPAFTVKVVAGVQPTAPTAAPFRITTVYTYKVRTPNEAISYPIHIIGGRAPYAVTIAWGDNDIQTILRQTSDDFTISHTYGQINAANATRNIKIQAVDADGQASTLELQAVLRNPAFHAFSAGTAQGGSWPTRALGTIRSHLWIIWPGYLIIVLMVFSFWLGERQELATLLAAQSKKPRRTRHIHA